MAHELNIGTLGGYTIDQVMEKMVKNGIGIYNPNGIYIPDYSDIITGDIVLGNIVQMAGEDWIVCHFNPAGKVFNLMHNTIVSTTQFGGNTNYKGSTLASVAKTYEDNLPSAVRDRLIGWTINGVTQKVQVASKEQMEGGFQWFDGNGKRIATYNGTPTNYWTSSPNSSGYVYYVSTGGSLSNGINPGVTLGFRPCVALPM